MRVLFYIAIFGALLVAGVIFLEKNKKPKNLLIGDPQPQPAPEKKNEMGTDTNLHPKDLNLSQPM